MIILHQYEKSPQATNERHCECLSTRTGLASHHDMCVQARLWVRDILTTPESEYSENTSKECKANQHMIYNVVNKVNIESNSYPN